jgi:hypothetical protein
MIITIRYRNLDDKLAINDLRSKAEVLEATQRG